VRTSGALVADGYSSRQRTAEREARRLAEEQAHRAAAAARHAQEAADRRLAEEIARQQYRHAEANKRGFVGRNRPAAPAAPTVPGGVRGGFGGPDEAAGWCPAVGDRVQYRNSSKEGRCERATVVAVSRNVGFGEAPEVAVRLACGAVRDTTLAHLLR
jgi:hypothetical protein